MLETSENIKLKCHNFKKNTVSFMLRAGGLWCLEKLFINTSISALWSSSGQDERGTALGSVHV